jgi:murein DD-endopeptidase MepM/ murein hydrolase activator NlpD
MNEKLEYASMIEIPVNTCNITHKPLKKRAKKKKTAVESAKEQLIDKINAQTIEMAKEQPLVEPGYLMGEEPLNEVLDKQAIEQENSSVTVNKVDKKGKFNLKLSAITVQLIIIGVLLATIFITNSVYPNSGLNVFMRSVFGVQNVAQIDQREYSEFSPVFENQNVTFAEGVLTVNGKGSVYSSVDGTVDSVVQEEDGSYTIQVAHSTNFYSVISGLDRVYLGEGEKVYRTIPVGYDENNVQVCFKGANGGIISDFQVLDGAVIWAV